MKKYVFLFISLLIFFYLTIDFFYPKKMIITVPNEYFGEINLVLSNVNKDVLHLDKNGIGYITKDTYNKKHRIPIVFTEDGTDVTKQCVGYNLSTFWAKGEMSYAENENSNKKEIIIKTLSFELVPKRMKGEKQYYSTDLLKFVDRQKLLPLGTNR